VDIVGGVITPSVSPHFGVVELKLPELTAGVPIATVKVRGVMETGAA
jgi:hypothetical protein